MQEFKARKINMSEEEMGKIALAYLRINGDKSIQNFFEKTPHLEGEMTEADMEKTALAKMRKDVKGGVLLSADILGRIGKTAKKVDINPIRAVVFAEILIRERIDQVFP